MDIRDAAALRKALAAFLGETQYRRFIQHGLRRGRLRYWQEVAWEKFVALHPDFAIDLPDLEMAMLVCHLHGDELQSEVVKLFHGCVDDDRRCEEVRSRLFPRAAMDIVSTEGAPSDQDEVQVLYCPTCRSVRDEGERGRSR